MSPHKPAEGKTRQNRQDQICAKYGDRPPKQRNGKKDQAEGKAEFRYKVSVFISHFGVSKILPQNYRPGRKVWA